ncbi:preprotein translocase subunit YajC [Fodinibius sp.]|uniref:preprotein translocase subunit YajC n=1 Tax=Fodinibius sp. TaxID=1872440 RepID=UPI0035657532
MFDTAFFIMGSPDQAGWMNLLFLGAIFLIFYFFIIRPQSQRQKEIKKMVENLEKGDKIVTSGGMIAQVRTVDDDTVLAEIDSGVKARFKKSSITDVNPNQND